MEWEWLNNKLKNYEIDFEIVNKRLENHKNEFNFWKIQIENYYNLMKNNYIKKYFEKIEELETFINENQINDLSKLNNFLNSNGGKIDEFYYEHLNLIKTDSLKNYLKNFIFFSFEGSINNLIMLEKIIDDIEQYNKNENQKNLKIIMDFLFKILFKEIIENFELAKSKFEYLLQNNVLIKKCSKLKINNNLNYWSKYFDLFFNENAIFISEAEKFAENHQFKLMKSIKKFKIFWFLPENFEKNK
ncbi:hypothetical protein X271_00518 [Candidatus Hepatoplasma crinochetorum Av]|uniref:Uncharacterized protein n=1 Tax=Candidatus Hepatoplasma crinochetorum Av TaxID=1427984 RepID=W8GG96_9MOLU|nr:hypothetical protein [Candidatus Hepatoplasma crinochetorum]AHK22618.1 hypothetical protein X271_00518 [Candidatus Hepatoplasma crinochetorum Av]